METPDGVTERVAHLMAVRGLSQSALASATERVPASVQVQQTAISRLVRGATRAPSFDNIVGIALALGVPPCVLHPAVVSRQQFSALLDVIRRLPGDQAAIGRHMVAAGLAVLDAGMRGE